MKKTVAYLLIAVLAITAFSQILSGSPMFSQNPAAVTNHSPNTGDTPWTLILFIGLGLLAILLLVFVVMRRRK